MDIWAKEWKQEPYWHDTVSKDAGSVDAELSSDLAANADVVIIGSGYTGLNAALEIARAGRSVVVLDAADIGSGCSTRNGGQISAGIKPSLGALTKKYDAEKAHAIRKEGRDALDWIEDRITEENISCDFHRSGNFYAAHSAAAFEKLARSADLQQKHEGITSVVVSRQDQRQFLGTDLYHGGLFYPHHAILNPAKYHRGLLHAVRQAGAKTIGHCAVSHIKRQGDRDFLVQTGKGEIKAKDVVVATNGYTSSATKWQARRIIPIGSYIIATEPLPSELMDQLFPKNISASDTRKVVYYYRPSPDRKRIMFGGRVSANETDTSISGPKLHDDMCRIFPELRPYQITYSWMGKVAYTFDELPHIGVEDGIYYAMGYCGTGISLSSYLGMRLGQKVIGSKAGATAFDGLTFPTRPFYTGKPWFLPPMVAWYRWRDRMNTMSA